MQRIDTVVIIVEIWLVGHETGGNLWGDLEFQPFHSGITTRT